MINALFSSKSGGTKLFRHGKEKSAFGWEAIIEMYKREVNRARQQQTRMVPRLKEIHILRDSWTKLNVSPAKIMQVCMVILSMNVKCSAFYLQQEQVLTELYSHIHQDSPPADADTTAETHKFLEACNLLFEKGFLSHEKVSSMDSIVVQNISSGYQYFTSWLSALLSEGILSYGCFAAVTVFIDDKFPHTSNTQKSFLSWQSKYIIE